MSTTTESRAGIGGWGLMSVAEGGVGSQHQRREQEAIVMAWGGIDRRQ
jgi:hypothetical protein